MFWWMHWFSGSVDIPESGFMGPVKPHASRPHCLGTVPASSGSVGGTVLGFVSVLLGPWLSEAWLVGFLGLVELCAWGGACSLGAEGLETPPRRTDLALLRRCVPWAWNTVYFLLDLGLGCHCCSMCSAGKC